jgi:hypothetical protein
VFIFVSLKMNTKKDNLNRPDSEAICKALYVGIIYIFIFIHDYFIVGLL